MQTDLSEPMSVNAIAQKLGVSRRKLEIRFKAAVSQSPGSYYLDLRLAEAHRLASESAMQVQDIAEQTGFSSHAAFSRTFLKHFGRSVSDLRRS